MKDWLTTEIVRNKEQGDLFTRLLRAAFKERAELQVMIGHHLTIMYDGRLDTEDEIPSADTMMFDHDIMGAVFGKHATEVMMSLAALPVDGGARDLFLQTCLREMTKVK